MRREGRNGSPPHAGVIHPVANSAYGNNAEASEEMLQVLPEDWTLYNDAALHLGACLSLADKLPSPEARAVE